MRKIDVTSSYLGRLTRSDDRWGSCRVVAYIAGESRDLTNLRATNIYALWHRLARHETSARGTRTDLEGREYDLTRRPLEFLLLLFT